MRPLRIHAKNFLSHRDTLIDLSKYDSAVVVGKNGAGKSSFIVDAPLLAVFGKAREGEIDGYVRNGADLMELEYDFALGPRRYRVIRKRSKKSAKGSSSLEFLEINEAGAEIERLTKGTISETQASILRTIGIDYETLTRASVIQQDEVKKFCEATPSERMDLLSRIWDLDKWDEFASLARERLAGFKEHKRILESNIEQGYKKIFILEQRKTELKEAQGFLSQAIKASEKLEKEKSGLEKKMSGFQEVAAVAKEIKAALDRISKDIAEREKELKAIEARKQKFEAILSKREAVLQAVRSQGDLEKSIETLERDRKAFEVEIDKVNAEMTAARVRADEVIQGFDKERVEVEKEVRVCQEAVDQLNLRQNSLTSCEEQLKHLERDASKLEGIKCHPEVDLVYINKSCRFIKDAVQAKEEIPSLEAARDALRGELAGAWVAIGDRKKSLQTRLELIQVGISDVRTEVAVRIKKLSDGIDSMKAERLKIDETIQAKKKQMVDLAKVTAILPEISLAEAELPKVETERKAAALKVTGLGEERNKRALDLMMKEAQLEEKAKVEGDLQSCCKSLDIQKESRITAEKRVAGLEAEIAQIEAVKAETVAWEKEVGQVGGKMALEQTLEDAFKAVPYMLISRGIGSIETIANDILSMVSGTGLRVSIQTVKVGKTTKRAKDDINLVFQDEEGPKGWGFLSGGEKLRAAFALRLAISEALALRKGVRVEALTADELFGPLDAEGIETTKEVLRQLKGRFQLMTIITHITSAQDTFPTQFIFSKSRSGTEVEISEQY